MSDIKKISDDDLNSVNGGYGITINSLYPGDCFISRYTKERVYIDFIYDVLTEETLIKYRKYNPIDSKLSDEQYSEAWCIFKMEYALSTDLSDPSIIFDYYRFN